VSGPRRAERQRRPSEGRLPGRRQAESVRQERGQADSPTGRDFPARVLGGEDDEEIACEFEQHLPADSAWRPRPRPRRHHCANDGIVAAGRDHRCDRRSFRTEGGAVARVLHVASDVDEARAREQRGTDAIVRVGRMGPGACRLRCGDESFDVCRRGHRAAPSAAEVEEPAPCAADLNETAPSA
jgi:hypothetical protein